MKYLATFSCLALFLSPLSVYADTAESRVETHIFTNSGEDGENGFVHSSVKTSGDSHVRIRTVVNGEVVEDFDSDKDKTPEKKEEKIHIPKVIPSQAIKGKTSEEIKKENGPLQQEAKDIVKESKELVDKTDTTLKRFSLFGGIDPLSFFNESHANIAGPNTSFFSAIKHFIMRFF